VGLGRRLAAFFFAIFHVHPRKDSSPPPSRITGTPVGSKPRTAAKGETKGYARAFDRAFGSQPRGRSGPSGLVSGLTKMRSRRSISAIVCSASIPSRYPPRLTRTTSACGGSHPCVVIRIAPLRFLHGRLLVMGKRSALTPVPLG
jgi:hypothetical protein